MRLEGEPVADGWVAPDWALLCAGLRTRQAASPTAQAARRLASVPPAHDLGGLLDELREEAGVGRFNPLPIVRQPL